MVIGVGAALALTVVEDEEEADALIPVYAG